MAKITINEALNWRKTLNDRHGELVRLRDANSFTETRYIGANADKNVVREPKYDVKALDKLITRVARELRLLDDAVKATNAATSVINYDRDDAVLGEVE